MILEVRASGRIRATVRTRPRRAFESRPTRASGRRANERPGRGLVPFEWAESAQAACPNSVSAAVTRFRRKPPRARGCVRASMRVRTRLCVLARMRVRMRVRTCMRACVCERSFVCCVCVRACVNVCARARLGTITRAPRRRPLRQRARRSA
eukprot:6181489-Pleurochrysis_carterae.AAC.1